MPLIQGKSKKSFNKNVEAEMKSGKPQDQSLAIAYSVKRKNSRKKMADGGGMWDAVKKRAKEEISGVVDAAKQGGTYANTKDIDKQRQVEKDSQASRSKYAEGGEINESAASEKRPMPEEKDKDAKSIVRNSMKKALVDSDWTDKPTEAQAVANNGRMVKPIKHPKMVPSNAFSTRLRDEEDDLQASASVNEGPQKQPPEHDNEEGPNRQGPKVPDMQDEHSTSRKPYAKGGKVEDSDYDHPLDGKYEDDLLDLPPSEDEGSSMARSEEEEGQNRQGPAVPDMEREHSNGRKPYAEGGMAHEMMDQPREEAEEEHYASIAAAIMAKKERQSKLISDSDIDEQINMYEGGQVPGSDESMVDIMSNGAEHPNAYYNRNENEVLKENYDNDMRSVSQPSDSNQHGDADEASSENEHDQDIISRIRAKMAVKRAFR